MKIGQVAAQDQIILKPVYRPESAVERMRGLLWRKPLGIKEGFWIQPCNSVHSFGMKYKLDMAFLNSDGVIIKLVTGFKPCRMALARNAKVTLEMSAGTISDVGIKLGDVLSWRVD